MSEAIERFEDAAEQMDALAKEINGYKRSRRRDRIIMIGLLGIMGLGGFGAWYTVHNFNDSRVQACQNRNDAARVTRQGFERLVSFVSGFVDNPQFMAGLIETLPKQSETELDCDGDDKLTEADYPPTEGRTDEGVCEGSDRGDPRRVDCVTGGAQPAG